MDGYVIFSLKSALLMQKSSYGQRSPHDLFSMSAMLCQHGFGFYLCDKSQILDRINRAAIVAPYQYTWKVKNPVQGAMDMEYRINCAAHGIALALWGVMAPVVNIRESRNSIRSVEYVRSLCSCSSTQPSWLWRSSVFKVFLTLWRHRASIGAKMSCFAESHWCKFFFG